MKKPVIILLTLFILLTLSACGGKDTPETSKPQDNAGVVSPITESSAEEISRQLGIGFNLPARADEISYSIIETGEENNIAQARFSLDGVACTYRIVKATGLEDISGMYYSWTDDESCSIDNCPGGLKYLSGEQGVCYWYDAVTGLLHCISVESDASSAYLIGLADYLYSLVTYTPSEDAAAEEADAPSQDGTAPADEAPAPADAPSDTPVPGSTPGPDADSEASAPVTGTGDAEANSAIAATAESLIGKAFAWGKSGPDTFDNSGLIVYCLKANGISAGRTAAELYAGGTEVSQDALEPGDIVFFTYEDDGSPSYCGVYIGDGLFIAASNPEKPIGEVDMTEDHYQQRYVGARRY